jgi:TorA maturation chaperone TorD
MDTGAPTDADRQVTGLLARAARYRLLATAFAHPEPGRLAELAGSPWPETDGDPESLRRAGATFREACAGADPAALQEEHVLLFAREVRCPPYETSWGDGRRLGGKPIELADVSGFYAAFAVEPSDVYREMPDHIGAELEFMSVLALKEAYALAEGLAEARAITREAARSFLGSHLGRWAPAFADGVEARAPSPVLRAAAALLRELIAAECRLLAVTPEPAGPMAAAEGPDAFSCPFAAPEPPVPSGEPAAGSPGAGATVA